MTAESLNIPKTVVPKILKDDLGKRKVCAMVDADKNFFNKIIMGDETWRFACDPETKQQSSEWGDETSPQPKKLKFKRSRIKTMLIIFFSLSQGVVHKEFVPERKTVNAEFYKGVMDHLLKRIQWLSSCVLLSRFFLVAR